MSRCNGSTSEDHDFQKVIYTWQTWDKTVANSDWKIITLQHSKERMICVRCGEIMDAFLEELAAHTAEVNKKRDMILNPPLMVEDDKTKIDPADWYDSPKPVSFTVREPRATLRDQFAMAAMQGVFSGNSDEFWVDVSLDVLKTTTQAYKWADKMMEERNK